MSIPIKHTFGQTRINKSENNEALHDIGVTFHFISPKRTGIG